MNSKSSILIGARFLMHAAGAVDTIARTSWVSKHAVMRALYDLILIDSKLEALKAHVTVPVEQLFARFAGTGMRAA